MIKAPLYLRTTHRYEDAWRHLDEQEYIGDVVLTPRKLVRDQTAFDDGPIFVQHATVNRGVDTKKAASALINFLRQSCRHEHDCCGCYHNTVAVKRIGRRKLVIKTEYWRNV